ncbi:MAG: isoprenyl transferase [Lentisphaeria bacterium]
MKLKKKPSTEGKNMPIKHLAIIMDGNGRWSTQRGMDRSEGHKEGANRVLDIVDGCHKFGIKYLTLYAFSTENWKRPAAEVSALMSLLSRFLDEQKEKMLEHGLSLRTIGDISKLPITVRRKLNSCMKETANQTAGILTLALNYGSRAEICNAVKECVSDIQKGTAKVEDINEDFFAQHLQNSDIPDPDLLIRTAGEQRLSNFLLWQLSYTEFYFTPVLWPDFDETELQKAIAQFEKRTRRFGTVIPPAAK